MASEGSSGSSATKNGRSLERWSVTLAVAAAGTTARDVHSAGDSWRKIRDMPCSENSPPRDAPSGSHACAAYRLRRASAEIPSAARERTPSTIRTGSGSSIKRATMPAPRAVAMAAAREAILCHEGALNMPKIRSAAGVTPFGAHEGNSRLGRVASPGRDSVGGRGSFFGENRFFRSVKIPFSPIRITTLVPIRSN